MTMQDEGSKAEEQPLQNMALKETIKMEQGRLTSSLITPSNIGSADQTPGQTVFDKKMIEEFLSLTGGEFFSFTEGQQREFFLKFQKLKEQAMKLSPQVEKPKRIYQVGKYKEYKKFVGVDAVKHRSGDPDEFLSQRKRKQLNASGGIQKPIPTRELTLEKLNRKGRLISDAIQEIVANLDQFDFTNT